jgi:hypothetical protein
MWNSFSPLISEFGCLILTIIDNAYTYNSIVMKYPKRDFSLSFVQYLKLLLTIFVS